MPTVALVGRPNVGKSTLFNRLTGGRDALVADVAGLTRDRHYGNAVIKGNHGNTDRHFRVVDTGGLFGDSALNEALTRQTEVAVEEADLVLLLLDARDGLTAADEDIVGYLRRLDARVLAVINKVDGLPPEAAAADFARLGLDQPVLISASHGRGMNELKDRIAELLPEEDGRDEPELEASSDAIRLAIVGRPNVGKSTLINRMLGEERQVVFDMPGTTMDAIDIPFERDGQAYVLIDTAGVRRKGRVSEAVEKFSVVKALDAMSRAHVVLLVLDAREGIVDQDLHVLKYAADAGAGLIIVLNKWDGLSPEERADRERTLDRRLDFVPWAPVRRISALHGTGVGNLWKEVEAVFHAGRFDVPTSVLTRLMEGLIAAHPPPSVRGRQIKLRFAHKAGEHPPTIAIHGNQTEALPPSYVRYLENGFREALNLVGNPVRLTLKTGENPYAGKRNTLTPRQERRRERVRRHRR